MHKGANINYIINAGDTSIFCSLNDLSNFVKAANRILYKVSSWAEANNLTLNYKKAKAFSSQQKTHNLMDHCALCRTMKKLNLENWLKHKMYG